MDGNFPKKLDYSVVPTPTFVVDLSRIRHNLSILERVENEAEVKILLALKGFAMWSIFSIIRPILSGVCASSPHEAMLGRYEFRKEVHAFAAAYSDADMDQLLPICDHIVFNSFNQWNRFKKKVKSFSDLKAGIRVNPEQSEVTTPLYDPCAPKSRLGVLRKDFSGKDLAGITGLHFHNLCELNADALDRTIAVFVDKFDRFLKDMSWVNFGGGHHITRRDYDLPLLIKILKDFKSQYPHLTVYLEPGEAVALNAGILVASVLDIVHNEIDIAVLDTSAATHMPDVLEMPYRPEVIGIKEKPMTAAGKIDEKTYSYRLAGLSCLAGDVIGDYSFDLKLVPGDKLVFTDMAHYTMVKTNTFNGLTLPSIAIYEPEKDLFDIVKTFGYDDYRNRLS